MAENNMGKRQFLVFNNTMWDCVCVQEFNLREENMRERERERESREREEMRGKRTKRLNLSWTTSWS